MMVYEEFEIAEQNFISVCPFSTYCASQSDGFFGSGRLSNVSQKFSVKTEFLVLSSNFPKAFLVL
jgi:hypothetical protein